MADLTKFKAEDILSGLKDFQRKSALNAYKKLYKDPDSSKRFLIADEVGLGKTIICKGLLALVVEDFLKSEEFKNPDHNLDIIYICSNLDIAGQNIGKLNFINDEDSFASRITLVPDLYSKYKPEFADPDDEQIGRVRFISFTPGTSFDLKQAGGWKKERALISYLLKDIWNIRTAEDKNFFKGTARNWRDYVDPLWEDWGKKDFGVFKKRFEEEVTKLGLSAKYHELKVNFKQDRSVPEKAIRDQQSALVGKLRTILAEVCLEEMTPDVVIMDEFQRFRDLFDEKTELGQLAARLFNYSGVRNVLLSATPYKMYTITNDDDENHYEDFLKTTSWLFGNKTEELKALELNLENFRRSVFTKGKIDWEKATESKVAIEGILSKVMSRTERVRVSKDSDGMIDNRKLVSVPHVQELVSFAQLEEISKALEIRNNVDYWKSSPYLLNIMEDYELKRKLKNSLHLVPVRKVLSKHASTFISKAAIEEFQEIETRNNRFDLIKKEIFKNESWKLLWIPPSAPYYEFGGVYAPFNKETFTKSLIFSSWKVVPRAVSSLISHEAESKLFKCSGITKVDSFKYPRALPIAIKNGELDGHRTMALLYPSLSLVEAGDIFALNLSSKPSIDSLISLAKAKLEPKLKSIVERFTDSSKTEVDRNWYWAAPLLLDKVYFNEVVRDFVDHNTFFWAKDGDKEDQDGFAKHVQYYEDVFQGKQKINLGLPPGDLIEKLAINALGGPANVVFRSLRKIAAAPQRNDKIALLTLMHHSSFCAYNLRKLFSSSEAVAVIKGSDDEDAYWQKIISYNLDGNFQSVCDEYFHILKTNKGPSDGFPYTADNDDENSLHMVCQDFAEVVGMRQGGIGIDVFEEGKDRFYMPTTSIRCKFALSYGDWKSEDGKLASRAETVRDAFNSPFRPFVLATTSIGQEGLDFHHYCHSIFHWNLPRNPVDMEQREGRIHRFKGHVIRKNIAEKHEILKYKDGDSWKQMFEQASLDSKDIGSDMVPYWVFDHNHKIQRHVPIIPFSKDDYHFEALLKTLARYRLAFGQPRQDELLKALESNEEARDERIKDLVIDLSPK